MHAPKAPPSREHSKVESGSLEEKSKLAELELTVPEGPEPTRVSGAAVSLTVTVKLPLALLAALSVAVQVTTVSPSGKTFPVAGVQSTTGAGSTASSALTW